MKIKVLTVATTNNLWLRALEKSAIRNGMDFTVLGIGEPWRGFGTKILLTAEYLKTLEGYTHFIFVDAYDTLFLKPITDYEGGILFSTEKHKWPDRFAAYPETDKVWPYLNSGSYIAPIKDYLELIKNNPVKFEDDDQGYFTNLYLKGENIKLDTECKLFQSYAFSTPEDFTINGTFKNNITGTEPSIIHFNGKCHEQKIYTMVKYQTLKDAQESWKDTPESHKEINEDFVQLVNSDPDLKAHRDFVEQNIFGFGERSFHWMWKLLIDEMPKSFTFLEIGVLKGQTLSLIELLAKQQNKKVKRYGVTPLSTEGGVWESDYKKDIEFIHDKFGLEKNYTILNGLSEDPEIIKKASKLKLDILYIDGGHEERHITNDIDNYAPLIKVGGYMVIDDCCNSFSMPFGYFQGIEAVSRVVDGRLPPKAPNEYFEFIFSVVHNRIYRRVK